MSKKLTKKREDLRRIEDMLANKIEPDTIYNLPGQLPFYYYLETEEGTIKWTCSYGPNGEIMSVYEMEFTEKGKSKEFQEMRLDSVEQACMVRDKHVKDGWRPTSIPAMKFNNEGEDLNREERRRIARKIYSGKLGKDKDEKKDQKDSQVDLDSQEKREKPRKVTWKYSDEEDSSSD